MQTTLLRWMVVGLVVAPSVVFGEGEEAPVAEKPRLTIKIEGKANYRNSDSEVFPISFPFTPEQLPPGQARGQMATVDPGSHIELSAVTLLLDANFGGNIDARIKIDAIDLYDRNPTSTDKKIDIDEAWLRFGRETPAGAWPSGSSLYAKIGKMPKFERQNDRHLESYGLISTAFNRFEDMGLEVGGDLGRHVYFRVSATQGNPVFLRDPNALAGDNGTPVRFETNPPAPPLGSGIPILYDAEVEDLDFDGDLETGAGLGFRLGSPDTGLLFDVMGWWYQRELADRVELEGTRYGGDLDLLDGPAPGFGLPISGNDKEEIGANLRLHWSSFTVFGQWVDQEIAGLDRTGWEIETAWRFDLPLVWAVGGKQVLSSIQPAIRVSRLEPEFEGGSPLFPAPSLRWEWDKIDYGVRVGLYDGIDLTAEFSDHTFVRAGKDESNDEVLVTLRFRR